jgi:hypothetical protein
MKKLLAVSYRYIEKTEPSVYSDICFKDVLKVIEKQFHTARLKTPGVLLARREITWITSG